jgi:hypothetical protein
LIRLLELGGLISDVQWPSPEMLDARRRVSESGLHALESGQAIDLRERT